MIIDELADMLSPIQREAFAVLLEAEQVRRAGEEADFDATVRAMMGARRWEQAMQSIPRDLLRAIFANAEADVAVRN